MKKKSILLTTLLLTSAILSACSGVSEQDFKALQDRVTALEEGKKHSGRVNTDKVGSDLESKNEDNGKEDNKDNGNTQASGSTITSKDGIEISFVSASIITDVENVIGKDEAEDTGTYYIYTVLDWKHAGTESTYNWNFYDITLTDGEILVEDAPFTNYDKAIETLAIEGVKRLPTPTTPKESGKTLVIFKMSKAAYEEASGWSLVFDGQEGSIPVTFN